MAQEQEKIFITDEKMQSAMRIDPEYADIKKELEKEDFKVVCFDDTQNKELFSGDKSKPIGDYQGLAIRSDLYVGDKSFYPLRDYCKNYFTQLEILMREIAGYMGACKWEFSYVEEIFEYKAHDDSADMSGGVESKDFSVGFGYASASNSLQNNDAKFSYQHSEEFVERKKSPQELADFIKEQGINLNAFDPSFKKQIQDYIKGEKIRFCIRHKLARHICIASKVLFRKNLLALLKKLRYACLVWRNSGNQNLIITSKSQDLRGNPHSKSPLLDLD